MPYKEAASWVCLTMFGTAAYFIFDWWGQERIFAAIAVGLVALIGLGYLVYQHHHEEARLPSSGIWVWLPLVLTWCFLAYAIHVTDGSGAVRSAAIPEFDLPDSSMILGWGQDTPASCYEEINGHAFLLRQPAFKLAIGCFIYDGKEDVLDAPYVQVSNLYDIRNDSVLVRCTYQPYFLSYMKEMHAIGIEVALLNVPAGIMPSQFTTLRQARALGVKIVNISIAKYA